MVNNNVFILFEEIKNMPGNMKSKQEELPKMIDWRQPDEDSKQNLSLIKETVLKMTKVQSKKNKGLLAKHWETYAQVSTVFLKQISSLGEQLKEPKIQQEQPPQEHIYRHSIGIKPSKAFSFLVGLYVICAVSVWGNIGQWQSKQQFVDNALKFRIIRKQGGCSLNDVLWLNKAFDIHRDEKNIEWVWKQVDGYGTYMKVVSDNLIQKRLRNGNINPQ